MHRAICFPIIKNKNKNKKQHNLNCRSKRYTGLYQHFYIMIISQLYISECYELQIKNSFKAQVEKEREKKKTVQKSSEHRHHEKI